LLSPIRWRKLRTLKLKLAASVVFTILAWYNGMGQLGLSKNSMQFESK